MLCHTEDTGWSQVQDAVSRILERDETKRYAKRTCRALGFASEWDDLRRGSLTSIWLCYKHNAWLAERIGAMSPAGLRNYVWAIIFNAAASLARKRRDERRRRNGWVARGGRVADDIVSEGLPASLERRDAQHVVSKVNAILDAEGRFALEVVLAGMTPEAMADRFPFSESTGRRWFRRGLPKLREAVDQVLGREFADEAVFEFARLVALLLKAPASDSDADEQSNGR